MYASQFVKLSATMICKCECVNVALRNYSFVGRHFMIMPTVELNVFVQAQRGLFSLQYDTMCLKFDKLLLLLLTCGAKLCNIMCVPRCLVAQL